MKRYTGAVAVVLLLTGCSMGKDLSSGGAAVDDFHRQLDSGQTAAIEAAAGAEIKAMGSGLAQLLDQIHARLGNVKSASRTGFNDSIDNGDHRLQLTYATKFERGEGDEEFVFRMNGGKPVLIGYHVKSDALKGSY